MWWSKRKDTNKEKRRESQDRKPKESKCINSMLKITSNRSNTNPKQSMLSIRVTIAKTLETVLDKLRDIGIIRE